jgi:predicted enzyme related to lactoylglutathione lyase
MSTMIEYAQGTPCWVDLSSPDLDASARFYGELLGWEAAASEGPVEETGGYRMFRLNGVEVAGLGPAQEGQPPAWTTYVAVDDAAAIKDTIEAAGGSTVMPPLTVMDAGTMAIFQDTAGGAYFAVWQPDRHRGAQLVNGVGALTMNELDTRDFDGASGFYGDVFGWEVARIEQDGALQYGSFRLDGRLVAGILPMGDNFPPQVPPHWRPYFGVEDLEAAGQKVSDLGGQVVAGPIAVPEGRFISVLDPHGAAFSLWQGSYDPPPGA